MPKLVYGLALGAGLLVSVMSVAAVAADSGASHGIFLTPYVELNRHFHNETLETGR